MDTMDVDGEMFGDGMDGEGQPGGFRGGMRGRGGNFRSEFLSTTFKPPLRLSISESIDLEALETLVQGAHRQWGHHDSEAEVFLGQEDPVGHRLEVLLHLPLLGAGFEPLLILIGAQCHLTECLLT